MKSLDHLSTPKNTVKLQMLRTQSGVPKYRVISEWQMDQNLQKVQPKGSRNESFIVKRKKQIQLNRWKVVSKQITNVQSEVEKDFEEFRRRMYVKIDRCRQAKLLKFVNVGRSQSLPGIHESFRRSQNLTHILKRAQPYWKNFQK